jgi:formylmethanofuran dehydrogenase subunit E
MENLVKKERGCVMELDKLLKMAIEFHGHKCPAMPLGLRAGLAAMKKLGVERASNKELFCFFEGGPAHAQMCFGDGVQVATGCTFGKENIEKLNYSKLAITLIDVKTKKAVRVAVKPDFQKKGLGSKFVQMRKEGIEPKDIPSDIVEPAIENIMKQPDEVLFKISEVFNFDFKGKKSTFEWYECENCQEVIFNHGVRVKDGKKLCISCYKGKE